jgi:hypothetical protein
LLPSPELAAKKPWSTPTVEEVPWDALPTEMRMLVLGLPDAGLAPQAGAVPDVPDVPDQVEPPAAAIPSHRQPAETAQPAAPVTEQDCAVCGGDLYRCFPLRCPLRSAPNKSRGAAADPVAMKAQASGLT